MKKVMIFGAIALFGLSSCKKDWTCECTTTVGSVSNKTVMPLTNQTKSSATTNCDAVSSNSQGLSALGASVKCELQ